MKQWVIRQIGALRRDWLKVLLISIGGLLVVSIGSQLIYPSDRMLPFAELDSVQLGGWEKTDAARQLDADYTNLMVPIYFGSNKTPYHSPKLADIGIAVTNTDRINSMKYPWYLRIVPSSILWAHFITDKSGGPKVDRDSNKLDEYINKQLGQSCDVKPQDASLKMGDNGLELVKSVMGGTCDISTVKQVLSNVTPRLDQGNQVKIPMNEIPPAVSDEDALNFADYITKRVGNSVPVTVNIETVRIPAKEILGWMDFATVDGKIDYSFSSDRASKYLNDNLAVKVAVPAGTTTISTYNFTETSRVDGPSGQALGVTETLASIKAYLDGSIAKANVMTVPVAPNIVYNRSYSSTDVGLNALIQQYAESHPGAYGVSMIELGGQNRRAAYNDTRVFTTASTYKLFVAYSTLKRIESGAWHWTDQISDGRDLTKCFDDMIVKSDNNCAKALLLKIGFQTITNEAHEIGATHTSFMGNDGIKTTPADLAVVLGQLQNGQILNLQSSRDTWINAMKRNVYRQGIPAGINAVVADKVGFLDALLHDAAIVYSPTGTYVLIIMTDGSSWGNIAELTSQIEALRNQ
ncbi:MAG TPA: class A beta-lactamase-related serine hydrolase [Candidatus Saccharibacteria bacterium]|nr:class A beta-lactamase-related serine hydrolase [Candidatus Saccharibacteria bacterium]HRQ07130.1 class A beta-lactamase-related serine hydrolase [Candidatus Saccharibacteria bacterium]